MCDVEQRLNTENINLATQSSKELIYALYCANFDHSLAFLLAFTSPNHVKRNAHAPNG